MSTARSGDATLSNEKHNFSDLMGVGKDRATLITKIPNLRWPEPYSAAVNFTVDFDAMLYRRVLNEPALQFSKGEFGGRVGVHRLIELFDSRNVKATFFTPGRICELYPEAVRRIVRSGHELADHFWEHRVPQDVTDQTAHVAMTVAALNEISGKPVRGSRSFYQRSCLVDAGLVYNSHGDASHLPYYVSDGDGKSRILELPFHFAVDDAQFYSFGWMSSGPEAQHLSDPDRVLEMWTEAFEFEYARGGYLNICLHPEVSGRALRIEMLDELISRMAERKDVWLTSCGDVAEHCLQQYPYDQLQNNT
jgi:peptidoglycan-N-acetylglucosamine deacetylase